MQNATAYLDVAQVVLYVFWLFFAGLILYIRREDRREGYPLIGSSGRPRGPNAFFIPSPKTFKLANGQTVEAPRAENDTREIKARPYDTGPGAALVPTGDPMMDAIGPGAYALRADVPDVTYEGHNRIVPIRVAADFTIEPRDPDPRGMPVYGADGAQGGTVRDVWVDRSEYLIRYLELEVGTANAARRVLLPINFCTIDRAKGAINVDAILGRHFANVPGTRAADRVTLLEEEKIMAYYGAGTLYATPDRAEPLV